MVSKSQLKYIQSLGQKKYRDEAGLFVAEGPKLVKELIQSKNVELTQIFALDEWIRENKDLLKSVNVTAIDEQSLKECLNLKRRIRSLPSQKSLKKKNLELKKEYRWCWILSRTPVIWEQSSV